MAEPTPNTQASGTEPQGAVQQTTTPQNTAAAQQPAPAQTAPAPSVPLQPAPQRNDIPEAEYNEFLAWKESQKTAEEKHSDAIRKVTERAESAERKAAELEMKLAVAAKGVNPEAVDDVVALAQRKVSDKVTLEQAVDEVLTKYPQFGGTAAPKPPAPTTGTQTANGGTITEMTGVEAAFYAKNPGLKK